MNDVKRQRLGFARSLAGAAMVGGAWLGGAGLAAGCATTTTATLYTPYTGLRISSAELFAGYTCGLGPGQVYAYVAVVSDASEAGPQPTGLPTANTYLCGADGAFQNLPGSGFYNVAIYAYDRASFPAELACTSVSCAPTPTLASDLGTPNWTTTCMGIEEPSVNALVQCQPLASTSAEAVPEAGVSQGDDGAVADAGGVDATLGGGSDGGVADATVDASDTSDGTADAGTTADAGAGDGGDTGDTGDGTDGADADDASDASDGS